MVATKLKSPDRRVDVENVWTNGEVRLLKTAAIYGANGSGKSNVIHALKRMRLIVLRSSQIASDDEILPSAPFLLDYASPEQTTSFEVIFLLNSKIYRYGFEFDVNAIVSEWLYKVGKSTEANLFLRANGQIKLNAFAEGAGLEGRTEDRALFLTTVAQLKGELAKEIQNWFRNIRIISGYGEIPERNYTITCFESGKLRQEIQDLIGQLDFNISAIRCNVPDISDVSLPDFGDKAPSGFKEAFLESLRHERTEIETAHTIYDAERNPHIYWLDLKKHESDGTQKIFALAAPILEALQTGRVLIVDEIDARLHPLLTQAIIRLFNNPLTNNKPAQLIFTTHDTKLLESKSLRRDQVWFTDKKANGQSKLYSLAEIRVRNDSSFESDYLAGKYGGVPFIADVLQAFEAIDDAVVGEE